MEALCFGQAGLLENDIEDPYYLKTAKGIQLFGEKVRA